MNVLRRDYAITFLTVSFVLCNVRKNVTVIAQQPHTSGRTIGKSHTVGYRSGYLVLPLAMPQHSLATHNSIRGQVLLLITF